MEDSILNSVKKQIGISSDYDAFDTDIVLAINTAFYTLWQLGIGKDSSKPFMIEDESAVWSDFIEDGRAEMVKSYVGLRARVLFDPPTSSIHMDAINKQIEEYEWRMLVGTDMEKLSIS